jgi:GntR family transcriptional regulator / MocR family aminotransferase
MAGNSPPKGPEIMWERLLRLSADSHMSLQAQIRQMLVSAILDGHLGANTAVPSSRELAERLRVARNTVVLAYQQLVDEGYLLSRERSGYFVNPAIVSGRAARPERPLHQAGLDAGPEEWAARFRFRPSAQRNIAKAADWQTYKFPFIGGQFDPTLFPTSDWRECCLKVLSVMEIRDWAPDLFTRDDASLIEQIQTKVLPLRGVWAAPEEIIVTIGAQHALYMLADLLVRPTTTVGLEDPGYPDARNIFANRTDKLLALPVDGDGLVIGPHLNACDYVYTTPSHQSPTTVTMPLERRQALLELAKSKDFLIIEDDYEPESRLSETPNPALKSLDEHDRVIYIGSLSKTLAPGLRLGYIVASRHLIEELRALRRLMIRHPTAFIQRSFALFLSLGHYDSLIRRLTVAHRERADALMAAIAKHLPDTTCVPVHGGSSCWVTGPAWLDARALALKAASRGVLIEPGDVYFTAASRPLNHFRLGFGSIRLDRIEPGIRLLADAMRELQHGRK